MHTESNHSADLLNKHVRHALWVHGYVDCIKSDHSISKLKL